MSSAYSGKLRKLIAGELLTLPGIACGISLLVLSLPPHLEMILSFVLIALPAISLLVYLPSWWKRN